MPLEDRPDSLEELTQDPGLAVALESDSFKQFLDQVPIAVAVARIGPSEKVVYANLEFERLSGPVLTSGLADGWQGLSGAAVRPASAMTLGESITRGRDYLGAFKVPHVGTELMVDAWSTVIDDDEGNPAFRLVALVRAATLGDVSILDELEAQVREKDTQLLELQHRVKNNLQMITALIRVEARGISDLSTGQGFDRLAGRVEALGLLYRALNPLGGDGLVDLGIYLSEIASAVMRAHAVEGIHLDLRVETWLVSLNVAMPTGLVVNELLTNTLTHAFAERDGGVITLHSNIDAAGGCRIIVADNGVGLPEGYAWPKPGKLSALIVRSLVQNANAQMDVASTPGEGVQVVITFSRADGARV
jgi:two-component sensor histidine kinase